MKKFALIITAALLLSCIVSCTSPADSVTTGADAAVQTSAKTDAVSAAATEAPTGKVTDAPTEKVTEAPTEKVTEAPAEPVTEAPTEPATEAPTEPATEAPTEPVTDEHTEKVPGDNVSVLTKETYYLADGSVMYVYEYDGELLMQETYYYFDGTFSGRTENIYNGTGDLMGSVYYNEQNSVSESTEVTYETVKELGDVTTHYTRTKYYNTDKQLTEEEEYSESYDFEGHLLYGTETVKYYTFDIESGNIVEDTVYTTLYEYLYQDGLMEREVITSGGYKITTVFTYNADGDVIRADTSYEGMDIKPSYVTYDYADGGLLLKESAFEFDGSLRNYTVYDYNEYYQVLKTTTYDETNSLLGYTEYEYTLIPLGVG